MNVRDLYTKRAPLPPDEPIDKVIFAISGIKPSNQFSAAHRQTKAKGFSITPPIRANTVAFYGPPPATHHQLSPRLGKLSRVCNVQLGYPTTGTVKHAMNATQQKSFESATSEFSSNGVMQDVRTKAICNGRVQRTTAIAPCKRFAER